MRNNLLFAIVIVLAGASLASAQTDPGYSLFNESIVGVTNSSISGYIGTIPGSSGGDATSSFYNATRTFGGKDRTGADGGTMTFVGSTRTSTQYGALHVVTSGSVTNSFYNASNPVYYDSRDDSYHPDGTPEGFASLGFAGFSDTLQFGGALQSGYLARYMFHIDGTNGGVASAADLAVNVSAESDAFFDFDPGSIDTVWGTREFAVNGQTPQKINVQFSDQFAPETMDYADGSNYSGTSDFGATVTLTGIVLYDANGNVVPTNQWSVTSASGTAYRRLDAVPEPASLFALGGTVLIATRRRKNR